MVGFAAMNRMFQKEEHKQHRPFTQFISSLNVNINF